MLLLLYCDDDLIQRKDKTSEEELRKLFSKQVLLKSGQAERKTDGRTEREIEPDVETVTQRYGGSQTPRHVVGLIPRIEDVLKVSKLNVFKL